MHNSFVFRNNLFISLVSSATNSYLLVNERQTSALVIGDNVANGINSPELGELTASKSSCKGSDASGAIISSYSKSKLCVLYIS